MKLLLILKDIFQYRLKCDILLISLVRFFCEPQQNVSSLSFILSGSSDNNGRLNKSSSISFGKIYLKVMF